MNRGLHVVTGAFGVILRDDVITRAEIRGLMQGLVSSNEESLDEALFSGGLCGGGRSWVGTTIMTSKKGNIRDLLDH